MFIPFFHSVIFSQVLGLYLVIMSIIMLAKTKHYRDVILRLDPYSPSLLIGSSIWLLFGCFMIVVHNLWAWEPRVLVTIIGWMIFVKSIFWLGFPVRMFNLTKKVYLSPWYYIMIAIMFAMGVLLFTKGFYIAIPEEHLDYTIF